MGEEGGEMNCVSITSQGKKSRISLALLSSVIDLQCGCGMD